MFTIRLLRNMTVLATAACVLAACAETRFVMHTAKRLGNTATATQGDYKVGKPYKIRGVWYYPAENWTYDRTGVASWYGPNFDGKPTANGEVFDQWGVSAAHKTLPLPSIVRVTNLDNGRSLVVRINDRGPFVGDRVIDMSRRAAQLLGFESQGTARVRVQVMTQESKAIAQRAKAGKPQLSPADSPIKSANVATEPVAQQDLQQDYPVKVAQIPVTQVPVTSPPVVQEPIVQTQAMQAPVLTPQVYVQAGAFSDKANAERVRVHLSTIGEITVTQFPVNGRDLFRVRVGPVGDAVSAERLLTQVVRAGYTNARTVTE